MRVLLTSATKSRHPLAISCLDKVLECAKLDRIRRHELVSDPEAAELVLFVEVTTASDPSPPTFVSTPSYVVREKCFVYNSSDRPIAHLPGLYASIERSRYDPGRIRTCHYLSSHITVPPVRHTPDTQKRLLYSFIGDARNAAIRRHLLELRHPRGKCVDISSLIPTSGAIKPEGRSSSTRSGHSGG